jgi:hypothetical protein
MPIAVNSKFRFSQYFIQDDGGWCGGISHAIITHLHENLGVGQLHVDPIAACAQTQEYVTLLTGTYNKATGTAPAWADPIRRPVRQLQRAFNIGGVGKPPGTFEYTFDQPGTALLSLAVREPAATSYGDAFLGSWSWDDVSNHAGVAVWDTNGCIFLFDPNCGGIMVHWTQCNVVPTFPTAVDMAFKSGYAIFDRMKGGRSAKLVSALKLDPAELPYGSV